MIRSSCLNPAVPFGTGLILSRRSHVQGLSSFYVKFRSITVFRPSLTSPGFRPSMASPGGHTFHVKHAKTLAAMDALQIASNQ